MSSLGPDFYVAYVPNPYLDPLALFMELLAELGVVLLYLVVAIGRNLRSTR